MYETVKVIRLSDMTDVKDFVRAAGDCDFDIDVKYNRTIIDAKSLLVTFPGPLNSKRRVSCSASFGSLKRIIFKLFKISSVSSETFAIESNSL